MSILKVMQQMKPNAYCTSARALNVLGKYVQYIVIHYHIHHSNNVNVPIVLYFTWYEPPFLSICPRYLFMSLSTFPFSYILAITSYLINFNIHCDLRHPLPPTTHHLTLPYSQFPIPGHPSELIHSIFDSKVSFTEGDSSCTIRVRYLRCQLM